MTILEIAKKGYESYSEVTGNKNFLGKEMPKFDDLPEKIKEAWCNATVTILHISARRLLEMQSLKEGEELLSTLSPETKSSFIEKIQEREDKEMLKGLGIKVGDKVRIKKESEIDPTLVQHHAWLGLNTIVDTNCTVADLMFHREFTEVINEEELHDFVEINSNDEWFVTIPLKYWKDFLEVIKE
jgi:hypothetical protein